MSSASRRASQARVGKGNAVGVFVRRGRVGVRASVGVAGTRVGDGDGNDVNVGIGEGGGAGVLVAVGISVGVGVAVGV